MITAKRTSSETKKKIPQTKTKQPTSPAVNSKTNLVLDSIPGSSSTDTSSNLAALAAIAAMTTANPPQNNNNGAHQSSDTGDTRLLTGSEGSNSPILPTHNGSIGEPILFKSTGSPPPFETFASSLKSATINENKVLSHPPTSSVAPINTTNPGSSKLALSFIASNPVSLESLVVASSPANSDTSITTAPSTIASPSTGHLPIAVSSGPSVSNSRGRKRSSTNVTDDNSVPMSLEDEIAIKRMKNTEAARRSRLRKAQKMESLEQEISELKTENSRLQTRVAVLESEKTSLREKSIEKDARVRQLEQQLSEAYERLVKRELASGLIPPKERQDQTSGEDSEKCQTIAIGKAALGEGPQIID
ncbi:hypothetical protein G9A89_015030 [Geosiphon pyriformis]|nr:hypothetical protein G9A89_015030 [Geosiphon pyriformis]